MFGAIGTVYMASIISSLQASAAAKWKTGTSYTFLRTWYGSLTELPAYIRHLSPWTGS